jgi:hypothetical protein
MNNLRADILQHLLWKGASSAREISWWNNYSPDDVYDELQELRTEEVVTNYLFEDVENGPDFDPDCDVMLAGSESGEYLCARCCIVHNQSDAYLCAMWTMRGHMIVPLLVAEVCANQ